MDPAETDVMVAEQLVTVVMTISVVTTWEVARVVVGAGVVATTLVDEELAGTTMLDEAGRTDVKGVVVRRSHREQMLREQGSTKLGQM